MKSENRKKLSIWDHQVEHFNLIKECIEILQIKSAVDVCVSSREKLWKRKYIIFKQMSVGKLWQYLHPLHWRLSLGGHQKELPWLFFESFCSYLRSKKYLWEQNFPEIPVVFSKIFIIFYEKDRIAFVITQQEYLAI